VARPVPRRRAAPTSGGPGWGNVLLDALLLLVVVGIGAGIAEALDWRSRSFRVLFFGVILLGLVVGYAVMIAWNAAHEGDRSRPSARHARGGRRAPRHQH
jgi:phage shock protein PspC (stress-responsive transcriptional regulator)